MIATTYGGRPDDDVQMPDDMGVIEVLAAPRLPVWPFTTRRMRRKIGWVLYEVHGFDVRRRMVYARAGDQR